MSNTKEKHFVNINNHKICYYSNEVNELNLEEQTTVLVIHGAMGNAVTTSDFSETLASLGSNKRVFQLDLPGHGNSNGDAVSSISELADIVIQFISHMQEKHIFTDKVVLVGHSMGGSICIQTCLNGFKPTALVLISSAPEWSSLSVMKDVTSDIIGNAFKGMMEQDFSINTTIEERDRLVSQIDDMAATPEASLSDIKALLSFDVKNEISTITSPVLIVYGDNDFTATIDNQNFMLNHFNNSTAYFIEGGTHTTVIKNAEEVANAVNSFIEQEH